VTVNAGESDGVCEYRLTAISKSDPCVDHSLAATYSTQQDITDVGADTFDVLAKLASLKIMGRCSKIAKQLNRVRVRVSFRVSIIGLVPSRELVSYRKVPFQ